MTAEPATGAPEVDERERLRSRAVSFLLGMSRRLAYLSAATDRPPDKVRAELAGLGAWVEAFTRQLAGLEPELSSVPSAEVLLVRVELEATAERLVDGRASLDSEGLERRVEDAASRRAALALALVELAQHALALDASDAPPLALPVASEPEDEVIRRHREAELRLARRLSEAVRTYFFVDLDPDSYVPEISAHGFPEDG